MTATLATWRPRVSPEVPGCPNPIIEREILEAAREFCDRSRVWKKQLPGIELKAGIQDYLLSSSDGDILGVKSARLDDTGGEMTVELDQDRYLWLPYTPSEDSDLYLSLTDLTFSAAGTIVSAATDLENEGVAAGDQLCVTGTVLNNRTFGISTASTMTLTVSDDETVRAEAERAAVIGINILVVWVYLQPLKTATALETFLWNDWEAAISAGAKARLMRMRNRPWFDPQMAAFYRAEFDRAIASAFAMTGRGGRGNKRMKARNKRFVC